MKPRSWRWWHWLAACLVLLVLAAVTAAVGLRSWSTSRLQAVEARLQGEGRPTRYAEILSSQPQRDAVQHAAWLAIEARWEAAADTASMKATREWIDAGASAPPPLAVTAWLTAEAGLLDDTMAALQRAPVVIGTLPDPALFSNGRHPGLMELQSTKAPNLVALRAMAVAIAATAVNQGDEGLLAGLDRLVAAFVSRTLIDGMILRAIVAQRDQARLLMLFRGLAGPDTRTWATSEPLVLAAGRAAIRGERLLFSGAFAASTLAAGPFGEDGGLYWWGLAPADAAISVDMMAGLESRLNGVAWVQPPFPRWSIISRISMPNCAESCQVMIEADAQERATRIAAGLLLAWRDGNAPAVDQAGLSDDLRGRLLPPIGAATLRYMRTGDGFVIEIDPVMPRPPSMTRAAKALGTATPLSFGAGVAVAGPPAP